MSGDTMVNQEQRQQHLSWLKELTQIPTAAGHEQRVIDWIERWARERPGVVITRDQAGNLHVARATEPAGRPVYFTAHMDHPAFVVERIVAPEVLECSFRGGVMDDYFTNTPILVHDSHGQTHKAAIFGEPKAGEPDAKGKPSPFKHYLAELIHPTDAIAVGDVAVWDLPHSEILEGILHAPACDDLAALAAAVAAFDVLLNTTPYSQPVRMLFTRAEEIGFVGAIGACREGTMPREARVIALENSRSFADSPIGGGPIVRVGDRMSIFTPGLTDAIAKRAEEIAGGAPVTASQKLTQTPAWKWQRKLMAGGACEASAYCAAGYEATCVCLPLGNYHNMSDLERVQAGDKAAQAKIAREFISVHDFEGLVDLLIACGRRLPPGSAISDRFEKLWNERSFVLS